MAAINLKELVGRLNDQTRRALEGAAGLCLSRTNYNVEIEHWLLKLLESPTNDLGLILRQFSIDPARVSADWTRILDRFKTGNSRPPALSQNLIDAIREAWLAATIEFGDSAVRSGHILYALLASESMSRSFLGSSKELDKISVESLRTQFRIILDKSEESGEGAGGVGGTSGGRAEQPGTPGGPAKISKTPALDQYTNDLTKAAKAGKIDPVLGRDPEIRQIIDILMRRRQNNPVLTGEAGVGKTAVVEGFALRIAAGDVPEPLRNVSLRSLDLGLLQAGAGVKGEFENRLKQVIDEVKKSAQPVILFIDEAHTLIGAGGQAGQGDAANMLKPALARGELRTVAATTWAEYKKYFERDAALARRFQVVKVEEPDEAAAFDMLCGLVATLEKHHNVVVLQEAVEDAVRLSKRYVSGRQLPDKAVSVLDTTCARIAIGQATTPAEVEDMQRRLTQLDVQIGSLEREQSLGANHSARVEELTKLKTTATEDLAKLQKRWTDELELVKKIRAAHERLTGKAPAADAKAAAPADGEKKPDAKPEEKKADAKADDKKAPVKPLTPEERTKLLAELSETEKQLKKLQGETPLIHVCVDRAAVAETISNWTGIPLGRMVSDELKMVLNLRDVMEQTIVGQTHALEAISQRLQTSRAKLSDPRQPIGVFLLAGTSGVGKTETAITLANLFYGGEQNMTVINMSEFKEEHKVSLLMGSPPGYVGYGEGGVLTEAVRRKPYSVLLLDEMEKAHPGVQDIFYQVFDKGNMRDGEGRDIDFKNTMILMTSNAGTDLIKSLCSDIETRPDPEGLAKALFPELLKVFKPAFLGRLTVVPYYPLSDDVMKKIAELKVKKIARRVKENYNADFVIEPALIDSIVDRCKEVDTGARQIDHILSGTLLPQLSQQFLARMAEEQPISKVTVGVGEKDAFTFKIE